MPGARQLAHDLFINAFDRGTISREEAQQLLDHISDLTAHEGNHSMNISTPESNSGINICTQLTGNLAEVCIAQFPEFACHDLRLPKA